MSLLAPAVDVIIAVCFLSLFFLLKLRLYLRLLLQLLWGRLVLCAAVAIRGAFSATAGGGDGGAAVVDVGMDAKGDCLLNNIIFEIMVVRYYASCA